MTQLFVRRTLCHRAGLRVGVLGLLLASVACRDIANTRALPTGTTDPGSVANATGAEGMYRGVVGMASTAFLQSALLGGLLTDELQPYEYGGPPLAYHDQPGEYAVDARQLPEVAPSQGEASNEAGIAYIELQNLRTQALHAVGFLSAYLPADSALRGHLYALAGYAELHLADLFCSGVPLSTLDYNGDYTLRAGSTTSQVYANAVELFDTALALSHDSVAFQWLARVGKARALVAMGQFAVADTVVQPVPDDFRSAYAIDWGDTRVALLEGIVFGRGQTVFQSGLSGMTVADRDGGTGLPYRSSGDPRTESPNIVLAIIDHSGDVPPAPPETVFETNAFGIPMSFPSKYGSPTGVSSVTLADGIEARLIHAEAAFHSSNAGAAIQQLNALRTPYIDAGQLTAIPTGLSQDQLRDTLFSERAAWLFLTGHRQGDLRRLVRPVSAGGYGRLQNQVYPTGSYGPIYPFHGTDVNFPIPSSERLNPHFTGCLSRDA